MLALQLLLFRGLGGGFGKSSYVRRCRPAFLRFSKGAFFVRSCVRSASLLVSGRLTRDSVQNKPKLGIVAFDTAENELKQQ